MRIYKSFNHDDVNIGQQFPYFDSSFEIKFFNGKHWINWFCVKFPIFHQIFHFIILV